MSICNLWEILSQFKKSYESMHERALFTSDYFIQ